MQRSLGINFLIFFALFLACGSSEESSSSTIEKDKTEKQESASPISDRHPCEQLDVDAFAGLIGQSADAIELRKEDLGNEICTGYLLGDNDDSNYDDLLIFHFDFMKSKNGFPNFHEAIVNILEAGTFTIPAGMDKGKEVAIREVNAGDKAYIYSAQDFTTLMMHRGNQTRYTLTFFRQVGDDGLYEGLNFSPGELEEKLVQLARTLE